MIPSQIFDKKGKELELMDDVKDDISGLTGVLVSITFWSNGCVRLGVQAREIKDGMPVAVSTIDVEDTILVKKAKKAKKPVTRTGGPKPDPVRR